MCASLFYLSFFFFFSVFILFMFVKELVDLALMPFFILQTALSILTPCFTPLSAELLQVVADLCSFLSPLPQLYSYSNFSDQTWMQ